MARDDFDTERGGFLADRYGRPQLVVKELHEPLDPTDIKGGDGPMDADRRKQIVLVGLPGLPGGPAFLADFDVARFGATGDGSTVDGPAVQDAIAALVAHGSGTLVFGPGTFVIDVELARPNDKYMHIRGDGTGSTILKWNSDLGAGTAGIRADGTASQVVHSVSDLTLHGPDLGDGLAAGEPGAEMVGLETHHLDVLERVEARGFGAGFGIREDHEVLRDCVAQENFDGVRFIGGVTNAYDQHLDTCILTGNRRASIAVEAGEYLGARLTKCHLGFGPVGIMKLGGTYGEPFLSGILEDCAFESCGNMAIYDASGVCSVQGLTMRNCRTYDIGLSTSARTILRDGALPTDYVFELGLMQGCRFEGAFNNLEAVADLGILRAAVIDGLRWDDIGGPLRACAPRSTTVREDVDLVEGGEISVTDASVLPVFGATVLIEGHTISYVILGYDADDPGEYTITGCTGYTGHLTTGSTILKPAKKLVTCPSVTNLTGAVSAGEVRMAKCVTVPVLEGYGVSQVTTGWVSRTSAGLPRGIALHDAAVDDLVLYQITGVVKTVCLTSGAVPTDGSYVAVDNSTGKVMSGTRYHDNAIGIASTVPVGSEVYVHLQGLL